MLQSVKTEVLVREIGVRSVLLASRIQPGVL
jgi:hypothetical protein